MFYGKTVKTWPLRVPCRVGCVTWCGGKVLRRGKVGKESRLRVMSLGAVGARDPAYHHSTSHRSVSSAIVFPLTATKPSLIRSNVWFGSYRNSNTGIQEVFVFTIATLYYTPNYMQLHLSPSFSANFHDFICHANSPAGRLMMIECSHTRK